TVIARCTASTSSIASRIERIAIGSPHPGHSWCSPTSMSAGLKSTTRRAGSAGGASVGRNRSELIEHALDASTKDGGVEVGRDPEPGAVEAQAADEVDRGAAQRGEADVVEHLPLVVLVDRERLHPLGDARDQLRREGQQRDG